MLRFGHWSRTLFSVVDSFGDPIESDCEYIMRLAVNHSAQTQMDYFLLTVRSDGSASPIKYNGDMAPTDATTLLNSSETTLIISEHWSSMFGSGIVSNNC